MNDFQSTNETIKDAGLSRSRLTEGGDDQRLGILYENDAWLGDLFDELARRSIPYTAIRMDDAALMLEQPPAYSVVFNRVSPSSYLRGHGPAIPYARSMLELLSAEGRRVINGAVSFSLETSKFAQLLLFKRLGVHAPRSILFNNRKQIAQLARDFPFPAILKPSCGGSGALIRLIETYEHLVSLLQGDLNLFGPDHLLLLQERLVADDGAVIRAEFIDGQFVYAMRVRATNTFNLCPAVVRERCLARRSVRRTREAEHSLHGDPNGRCSADARTTAGLFGRVQPRQSELLSSRPWSGDSVRPVDAGVAQR